MRQGAVSFLEFIGGLRYEAQTSAILQYLFLNSDIFRRAFIDKISSEFASTLVPRFTNGIFCQREVSHPNVGRIDLLIEAENCFLAIENKIWAAFQDDQPAKYATILKSYLTEAKQLYHYRILLIAPYQLESQIAEILAQQYFEEEPFVVYWQNIQKLMLKPVREHDSARLRIIAELLDEFIDEQISRYADLNFPRERLTGPTAAITNQYQRDFLYAIKSSFSDFELSRMGFGHNTYAGFYFGLANSNRRNWFGFHSTEHGTALQFHLGLDEQPPPLIDGWQFEARQEQERPYGLTFLPQQWPSDRIGWDNRINPVLKIVMECTSSTIKEEEATS